MCARGEGAGGDALAGGERSACCRAAWQRWVLRGSAGGKCWGQVIRGSACRGGYAGRTRAGLCMQVVRMGVWECLRTRVAHVHTTSATPLASTP
eukprot:365205-Chlamydomonas_euryale.AAC.10